MTKITKEDKKIIEDTNANVLFNNWMSEKDFIEFIKKPVEIDDKTKTSIKDCIDKCTSPAKKDIFNAFDGLTPESTRVLILGQDPYPPNRDGSIKAHGYAFSVKAPKKRAASLTKIFKAVDLYCKKNNKPINSTHNYNLEGWAKKYKVLLLNSALTYEKTKYLEGQYTYKKELSPDDLKNLEKAQQELQKIHIEMWEPFVINIMQNLFKKNKNVVVFLWGEKAQNLFNNYSNKENIKHYCSCHPQKRHKKGEEDEFLKEVPEHFIESGLDGIWGNI